MASQYTEVIVGERIMIASWLALTGVALATAPTPIAITQQEHAVLQRGLPVIRDSGTGVTIGIVRINATPETVLKEVMNLPPRIEEVGPIQDLELVETSVDRTVAKWTVSMMGVKRSFHVVYTADRTGGSAHFKLDATRTNGIHHTEGSYRVHADEGATRLVYRNLTDPESKVPGWIRSALTEGSMVDQLKGIKKRSEQASR